MKYLSKSGSEWMLIILHGVLSSRPVIAVFNKFLSVSVNVKHPVVIGDRPHRGWWHYGRGGRASGAAESASETAVRVGAQRQLRVFIKSVYLMGKFVVWNFGKDCLSAHLPLYYLCTFRRLIRPLSFMRIVRIVRIVRNWWLQKKIFNLNQATNYF